MGESCTGIGSPVDQRGSDRSRLRQQGNATGLDRQMRKTRIQFRRRHDHADSVGSYDAKQERSCGIQHGLFQSIGLVQPRRDHQPRAGPLSSEGIDNLRHGFRWRHDNGEVWNTIDFLDAGEAAATAHFGILRIHWPDLAVETGSEDIGHYDFSQRAGPVRCTDNDE